MAKMLNQLPPDLLIIRIDTDGTVPGEVLLDWAESVLADLRTFEGVGPETVFKIKHLGQGSPTLFELVCNGLVTLGTIGLFATTLAAYLKSGEGKAAEPTINIVNTYNATTVVYNCAALEEPIIVGRSEIPSRIADNGGFPFDGSAGLRSANPQGEYPQANPENLAGATVTEGPAVDMIHNDADPVFKDEHPDADNVQQYAGELRRGIDGLTFFRDNGLHALVDGFAQGLSVPNETHIEIDATLRRGSRGGMADPRLIIWNWRPLDDGDEFEEAARSEEYDEDADVRAYEEAGFEPIVEDDPPEIVGRTADQESRIDNYLMPNAPSGTKKLQGSFIQNDAGDLLLRTTEQDYRAHLLPDMIDKVPLGVYLHVRVTHIGEDEVRVFGWRRFS